MKSNLLIKRLGGAVLSLCLLGGIALTSSSTTLAQWQNDRAWQREQIRRQRQAEREQLRRQRQAIRNQNRNGYQDRYGYDDYRYGGSSQLRQTALNAGYNEGIKEGRKDRQNGERFEFRDERDYQNANADYNSRLGNQDVYRQYFRQGFANGYSDGYRGY